MIRVGDEIRVFDGWPETKGRTFRVLGGENGIIYAEDIESGLRRAFPKVVILDDGA